MHRPHRPCRPPTEARSEERKLSIVSPKFPAPEGLVGLYPLFNDGDSTMMKQSSQLRNIEGEGGKG